MMTNGLKIFLGIAILAAAVDIGFTIITVIVGLWGLSLVLSGIAGLFIWLGSLLNTGSTPSHPQNPA
jgi:hypothetical protein